MLQDAYALLLSQVLERRSVTLVLQRLTAAAVSAAVAAKEREMKRELLDKSSSSEEEEYYDQNLGEMGEVDFGKDS